MSASTWWTLATAILVISLSPGAGAVNTMTNSMTQGWRRSLWGIAGQEIALILQVGVVAVGVGSIVTAAPMVLEVIRWLGAAYLVFLGLRMILSRPEPAPDISHAELPPSGESPERKLGNGRPVEGAWSMIRRGILVNLLNPKAIVFFLAFIPPFIDPNRPAAAQYLIIAVTCVSVDILVMWFGFAALAKPLGRFTSTVRGQRVLNTVFGCCFMVVALLLLLT